MSDLFNRLVSNPIYSIAKIFKRGKTQDVTTVARTPEVAQEVKQVIVSLNFQNLPKYSRNLIRLAGIAGLTAVLMGAYGAHAYRRRNTNSDLRELYNTAQYYHLVHSVALFGLPLVKRPVLVS